MGIKNYSKNLSLEDVKTKERIYDILLIDCNYLIHYLIYKCNNQKEFDKKIYNFINNLISLINIKSKIFLVFDGKYDKKFVVNPKQKTIENRIKYLKQSDDFDKQEIKPNSKIISDFKSTLVESLEQIKKINKKKFEIIINDDTIDGEADIKILEIINECKDKSYCLLSKDTDMILISYSLILKNNIEIDIIFSLRPLLFVDINKIVIKYSNFKNDYILLLLLLGNDFLPSASHIDYNILINSYQKYNSHFKKRIIYKNKIKNENLVMFITYYIISKNIKFNNNMINYERFNSYYNNLLWTLNYYKIIDIVIDYIPNPINNVINIYNFINNNI
jgi:hypothetical protein